MVTQADVNAWVAANPNATHQEILAAATAAGVSDAQIASAYGITEAKVGELATAAGRTPSGIATVQPPPPPLNPNAVSGTASMISPEFRPAATLLGSAVEAELGREYTPYQNERVQGFTPEQQAVNAQVMAMQTPAQIAQANQALQAAGIDVANLSTAEYQTVLSQIGSILPQYGALDTSQYGLAGQSIAGSMDSAAAPGALAGFINPYQAAVTDVAVRDLTRDYEAQQAAQAYQFSKAGAFGGARQGLAEAEAQRALNTQLGDMRVEGNLAAYNSALAQFNAEQQRQLAAGQAQQSLGSAVTGTELARLAGQTNAATSYGTAANAQFQANLDNIEAQHAQAGQLTGLATSQQALDLSRMQAQGAVGQLGQNLGQQQMDVEYQNFLDQRDWAKNQAGWASGIIQGKPSAQFVPVAPEPTSSNPWGAITGLGGAVTSLSSLWPTTTNK